MGGPPPPTPAATPRPTLTGSPRQADNPTYAGAIVNTQRSAALVIIRDTHPAYLTWAEHQALLAARGLDSSGAKPCGTGLVVQYQSPLRRIRGRLVRNTPYTQVVSCGIHESRRQAQAA